MTSPAGVRATTVVCVRHHGQVAIAADGQVSIGQTIVKANARKVRKLYHDRVLSGFAGAAADAFTLFSRFESKLDEHRGNLARAAVELAKDWRTDKYLRNLEALMIVASRELEVEAASSKADRMDSSSWALPTRGESNRRGRISAPDSTTTRR